MILAEDKKYEQNKFWSKGLWAKISEVILPDFMGFVKFMATHKITFNTLLKTTPTIAKISKAAFLRNAINDLRESLNKWN